MIFLVHRTIFVQFTITPSLSKCMSTLHTFGCSITQGFALQDTVQPIKDAQGKPLTEDQVQALIDAGTIKWEDIHINRPSQFAWPQQLADRLGMSVVNHARRGACFQQIARQCVTAQPDIQPKDVVIVMWTYLSRLSMQWPARTSVPYCNVVDSAWGWQTKILGMNKFFGLSNSTPNTVTTDHEIQNYIQQATEHTYLDPLGVYNRYYNSMVLQCITDGFLRGTGARVIHLSVEPDSCVRQLKSAQHELPPSVKEPYRIPNPADWYRIQVDHHSNHVILDPDIPTAPNDMHPSQQHHSNFAQHVQQQYFTKSTRACV